MKKVIGTLYVIRLLLLCVSQSFAQARSETVTVKTKTGRPQPLK